MKVFIPYHEKIAQVASETKISIEKQSIDTDVEIVLCNPTGKSMWKPYAKEICRGLMLSTGDEFTVINDCGAINLFNTNYAEMNDFLKLHDDYGAVSIREATGPQVNEQHICVGIIMFKKAALKETHFNIYPNRPSCESVMESLSKSGWKFSYLDNKIRCTAKLSVY
jgi:hypothetical protein